MKKIIFSFLLIMTAVICVSPQAFATLNETDIAKVMVGAETITVLSDGKAVSVDKDAKLRESLNAFIEACLSDSLQMPAYGVSIDESTKKEMQTGRWLRFEFGKTQSYRGMDFDTLLFKVSPEFCGFNVIRGNGGVYRGRCYYVDLNGKDLSTLYGDLSVFA